MGMENSVGLEVLGLGPARGPGQVALAKWGQFRACEKPGHPTIKRFMLTQPSTLLLLRLPDGSWWRVNLLP
jgi:hypothetical protein